jgi:hypothetical protein
MLRKALLDGARTIKAKATENNAKPRGRKTRDKHRKRKKQW